MGKEVNTLVRIQRLEKELGRRTLYVPRIQSWPQGLSLTRKSGVAYIAPPL